jgi:hypothetical protein
MRTIWVKHKFAGEFDEREAFEVCDAVVDSIGEVLDVIKEWVYEE